MNEPGRIVVEVQQGPDPSRPPKWPLLVGGAVVAAVALAVFGLAGEPPATGDVAQQPSSAELASVPSTAVTTTVPSTSTTVGVREVTPEEMADPANQPQLLEISPPPGMPVVTHLVEFRGEVFAFGPVTGPGEVPAGLMAARWDGLWSKLVEVAPIGETAVAVAGGDLGLVAVTVPVQNRSPFFSLLDQGPQTVRTSTDGFAWTETAVPADIAVTTAVVGREEAWIFGYAANTAGTRIAAALPEGYAELVEAGDLFVSYEPPSRARLYLSSLPLEVHSFNLDELGITAAEVESGGGETVALASPDLTSWTIRDVPMMDPFGAGTDESGNLYASAGGGQWRLTAGGWELAAGRGADLFDAAWYQGSVYGVEWSRSFNMRFVELGDDGVVRAAASGFADLNEATWVRPASGRAGVAFVVSAPYGIAASSAEAELADGRVLTIDWQQGELTVRDDISSTVLKVNVWDVPDSQRVSVDPSSRELMLTDDAETVTASVSLDALNDVAGSLFVARPRGPGGGILFTDGETWGFRTMGDVVEEGFVPSAVVGLDQGFVVASGPLFPFSPTEPSRVWLVTPPRPAELGS